MSDIERFEKNIQQCPMTGCWLWTGGTQSFGGNYERGYFKLNNKTVSIGKAAWLLIKGEIPDGLHVLHYCDVPSCANPNHLWLGTHSENMRDMGMKGRTKPCLSGSRNPSAKLTEKDILKIREIKNTKPTIKGTEIASLFNVKKSTIYKIFRGETWRTIIKT